MRRAPLEVRVLEALRLRTFTLFVVGQDFGAACLRTWQHVQHFVSPCQRSATDGWLVLWGQ